MPARDSIHDSVINALIKAGWEITDDPLRIEYAERYFWIDLAATEESAGFIGLEQAGVRIAIEIKSFSSRSPIRELEQAVGQYVLYNLVLQESDAKRTLYLAMPVEAFEELFTDEFGELVRTRLSIHILIIDVEHEEVVTWQPPPTRTF